MSSNKEERTSSVRRLTPTECLRLQGFPSDWLDLGDWTDESGKVHKETDTPKYKAIGNSICLPFWQFLARRICAEYERDITMGGLFSGIGGFELVFQRSGAIPLFTCEIEPYCNAVLERHFPEDDA
jgi:DNA (cytosine-5)-methyltransferase 1